MPRSTSKRPKKARKSFLHHAAGHVFGVAGVSVLAVVILCSFACTALLAGPALRSTQLAAVITATLVDLTNQDRAQNQLDGLTVNPLLTEAAQEKANDMAKNSYFAHTSPTGLTPWHWFKQAGYSFTYAGENLAVDFTDSDSVNQAWMNSPEHRANILNAHFTDIGIAEAQGVYEGQETTFVVQDFGSPADSAAVADDDVLDVITPTQPTQMAYASVTPVTTSAVTSASRVLGASVKPAPQAAPGWLGFLVASPLNLLRAIYIVVGALLLLALIIRTGFEFKKHHMRHVAVALVLLVLMGGLLYVASRYIFVAPIVAPAASVQSTSVL